MDAYMCLSRTRLYTWCPKCISHAHVPPLLIRCPKCISQARVCVVVRAAQLQQEECGDDSPRLRIRVSC